MSHAIIAGVNKCGTTSLFRYLSDHPEICTSSIKETRFFHDYVTDDDALTYANYRRYFKAGDSKCTVAIEASPSYFTSGRRLAERITSVLPDVKLIVVLRNPVDRLYSYFKSAQNYDNYATPMLEGYEFGQFVREAIEAANGHGGDDEKKIEFERALRQGEYVSHAESFHSVFPDSRVHYVFLERLRETPREVLGNLCIFCGVDASCFDNYDFTVENKSRQFRNQHLQRLAYHVNMRTEGFLNRVPVMRRWLRSIYLLVNEDKKVVGKAIDEDTGKALDDYYRESNSRIREFLSVRYPELDLPGWLSMEPPRGGRETSAARGA
jgi:uncharacterized protein CbrC (UPF0167 family)